MAAQTYVYSGNVYEPAADTTTFALTSSSGNEISYLAKSHIEVAKSIDEGESYTTLTRPDQWDFSADGKSVVLSTATSAGDWIRVKRTTPYEERYTTFQPSSNLTSDQLNDGEDFSLFVDQEITDSVNANIKDAPNDGSLYGRKSQAWSKVPDPGISDAPDAKLYGRKNGEWSEIPPDQTGVPEAPNTGKTYARKSQAWTEIQDGGGLSYKGTRDLTLAAPSSSTTGDFYINTSTSGTVDDSWTGIAGESLTGAERVVYNSAEWEMLPMPAASGAVLEVVAGNDITVNSANAARPVVSVRAGSFLTELEGGSNITITDGNTISVTAGSFVTEVQEGANITVTNGDTVAVEENSFIPYDISTLDELPDSGGGGGGGGGATAVTVTSSSFTAGGAIGQAYFYDQNGCPGQNTSPQLSWSIADLQGGVSVASWNMFCDDPDASDFVHWRVTDIPAGQTSIAENGTWQGGAQVQQNDFGGGRANGWAGPCPPEQHTYRIVVIAVLDNGSTVQSADLQFTAG